MLSRVRVKTILNQTRLMVHGISTSKKFEIIAIFYKYSIEEKAIVLATSLRGPDRSILDSLDNDELLNFSGPKESLYFTYGSEHLKRASNTELIARKRLPNEDLGTFATDLKRLVKLAYAEADENIRDKIACSQFIAGESNYSIQRMLHLEQILSLHAALIRATEIDAINIMEKSLYPNYRSNFYNNKKTSNILNSRNNQNTNENDQPRLEC